MKIICARCSEHKEEIHFNIVELFTFLPEFKVCNDCKYGGLVND